MREIPDFTPLIVAGSIALAIVLIVACWAAVEAVIWVFTHVTIGATP